MPQHTLDPNRQHRYNASQMPVIVKHYINDVMTFKQTGEKSSDFEIDIDFGTINDYFKSWNLILDNASYFRTTPYNIINEKKLSREAYAEFCKIGESISSRIGHEAEPVLVQEARYAIMHHLQRNVEVTPNSASFSKVIDGYEYGATPDGFLEIYKNSIGFSLQKDAVNGISGNAVVFEEYGKGDIIEHLAEKGRVKCTLEVKTISRERGNRDGQEDTRVNIETLKYKIQVCTQMMLCNADFGVLYITELPAPEDRADKTDEEGNVLYEKDEKGNYILNKKGKKKPIKKDWHEERLKTKCMLFQKEGLMSDMEKLIKEAVKWLNLNAAKFTPDMSNEKDAFIYKTLNGISTNPDLLVEFIENKLRADTLNNRNAEIKEMLKLEGAIRKTVKIEKDDVIEEYSFSTTKTDATHWTQELKEQEAENLRAKYEKALYVVQNAEIGTLKSEGIFRINPPKLEARTEKNSVNLKVESVDVVAGEILNVTTNN